MTDTGELANTEGAPVERDLGRLPTVYGELFGRDDDLDRADRLLAAGARAVLTVVGPGGVGKTRLAIAVGERIGSRHADGVRFVGLASERTAGDAAGRIRHALGAGGSAGLEARSWLESRDVLLILDNLEQIADAGGLVASLVPRVGESRLVVTSRGPLHIAAEQVLRLESLGAEPRPDDAGDKRGPAVALFVDTARAADADYAPSAAELDAVGELCRRLDGLPLAIRLAAQRRRLLGVAELLRRVEVDPTLLAGAGRDLEDRQRTIERSIGWSLDLLSDDERVDARLLSLAPTGWSDRLLSHVEPPVALSTLERLLDLGIIVREGDRLTMLQTVRDGVLASDGAHDAESRARLIEAVLRYGASSGGLGAEPAVLADDATLRRAIELCRERDEPRTMLVMVEALHEYWIESGTAASITGPLRWALERAELPDPSAHLRALAVAGLASGLAGDAAGGVELSESMVSYADAHGSVQERARARNVLGGLLLMAGRIGASYETFRSALSLEKEGADVSTILINLAGVAVVLDRDDEAHGYLNAALRKAAKGNDLAGHAASLMRMAELATRAGDLTLARTQLTLALRQATASHQRLFQVGAIYLIGHLALAVGELPRAAELIARTEALMDRERISPTFVVDEHGAALVDELRRRVGIDHWRAMREVGRDTGLPGLVVDAQAWLERQDVTEPGPLTPREGEIARLIAAGGTNQQIADQLFLSPRTVQTHVANMLRKLELPSRSALAAWQARGSSASEP